MPQGGGKAHQAIKIVYCSGPKKCYFLGYMVLECYNLKMSFLATTLGYTKPKFDQIIWLKPDIKKSIWLGLKQSRKFRR